MSDLNDEWALFLKNNGNTEMELVKDDTIKRIFYLNFLICIYQHKQKLVI